MPMQLLINGVDRSADMLWRSLSISESPQANGQSMNVDIMIHDGASDTPVGGEVVKLYSASGSLEFAGRIQLVGDQVRMNPRWAKLGLSCVDWTSDFDRHLIQEEFSAQLAGDIARRVCGLVGNGFTSLGVVDGSSVAGFTSDLEIPSSIISRVAEGIEHQWYIDYERDIQFFYIRDLAAPIDEIVYDTDVDTFFDLDYTEDVSQIKNRIWLVGAKVSSGSGGGDGVQDNIVFTADGDTKFVPLNYEPVSQQLTTVTVDGVPQEILLDSIDGFAGDGGGAAGQCYLCLDNWGLRFPDDHAPGAGDVVELDYSYNYEPVIQVEDPDSIAYMRERENVAGAPSDGVHEFKYNMPEVNVASEDAIYEYGYLLLERYAWPIYSVRLKSWIQGWRPGQSLTIRSTAHDFDRTFYLQSLTKRPVINTSTWSFFEYDLQFSSSPFPT